MDLLLGKFNFRGDPIKNLPYDMDNADIHISYVLENDNISLTSAVCHMKLALIMMMHVLKKNECEDMIYIHCFDNVMKIEQWANRTLA